MGLSKYDLLHHEILTPEYLLMLTHTRREGTQWPKYCLMNEQFSKPNSPQSRSTGSCKRTLVGFR